MKKYSYILPFLLSLVLTGCGENTANSSSEMPDSSPVAQEVTASPETDAPTEPPTNAPLAEGDINSVTFDEVGTEIASVINDDDTAVEGTLSIETIDGNNLLKFTDTSTTAENLETAVQKIRFNVGALLAPEQLSQVRSIAFDLYAEAKDNLFVNDDGDNMEVAGWIGGGGGSIVADGNWYGFADFSGSGLQEYNLKRSDACHVTFKFLLASSGKCWDETVEDVNFLVMRWGMQNISDIYIDNLTFFDEEGNSIPLTLSPVTDSEPEPHETDEISDSDPEIVENDETPEPATEEDEE